MSVSSTLRCTLSMSRHEALQRLKDAQTDSRVRIHYRSATATSPKTKTGVKTTQGGPIEAAAIDTGDEYDDGTPRILRVTNGGHVKAVGPKQTQRIGMLTDVDLPDDDDPAKVTLEDAEEVDWLKEGREDGGEEA